MNVELNACEKCGGEVAEGRRTCQNCGGPTTTASAALVERVQTLEAATARIATLEFGEGAGHPFRGNQHTSGEGGDGLTSKQETTKNEKYRAQLGEPDVFTNGEPGASSFLEGKHAENGTKPVQSNGEHSFGDKLRDFFGKGGAGVRSILADGELREDEPSSEDVAG